MSSIEIPLTRGKFAIIDRDDLEFIMRYDWVYSKSGGPRSEYARSSGRRCIRMHSYIMNCPEGMVVDHKNGDGLDNRKSNLRICTDLQNRSNQRKKLSTINKYKGIKKRPNGNWTVYISHDNKRICAGTFDTELKAALAYDKKAIELKGEFANLNFKVAEGFKLVYKWQ